jgi:hypothetical protein
MHQFKTTNIKGKAYVEVSQRILYFRTAPEYRGWSMETELISYDDQSCIIRAVAKNPDGKIMAVGHAQEDRSSSMINKTSYIENGESSAWGRCLANLGIGIETSIASAEEVDMAIAKQNLPARPQPAPAPRPAWPPQPQEMRNEAVKADDVYQKSLDYIRENPSKESFDKVISAKGKLFSEAQISTLKSLIANG